MNMGFPFRNILCPVDFDDSSMYALDLAGEIARQNDGSVLVLHVVPMIVPPVGMPVYVHLYQSQRQTAATKLEEIAAKRLRGLKYELLTEMGDPAPVILRTATRGSSDLVVMASHGRRGFSRLFLGSVAELVLRESKCPVLTVRYSPPQKYLVSTWMTRHPITAAPNEKLSAVHGKMLEGRFHSIPIVKDGVPVGIVTDHDIHAYSGSLDDTEASRAMSEPLITVGPSTTLREAARLLRERKIGVLPVVEEGKLAGVITTTDILGALTAEE
ncbi:MAG: universal stress protein [Deltaproteobacteria bacterium]|nr:universal stress protein [Deltaproteobacteria bacterium]